MLTQSDSAGSERVILYASQALTDCEKGYSTTEKEALAIVFATDHFHPYFLENKFTVITDHSALRWLHSVEPKGRLARWVMHLQEYEFDVVHRAGSENGNADGLSCFTPLYRGTPKVADTGEFSTTSATTINPSYNLQAAQREDPRLKVVIDLKSSGMPKPPFFVWRHNPILNALWHCWDSLHIVNNICLSKVTTLRVLYQNTHLLSLHIWFCPFFRAFIAVLLQDILV